MSKTENFILLSDHHQNEFISVAEPSLQALQKELAEKKRKIKRYEEAIVSKREQLAGFSNHLNKELEKHLNTKIKQSSFLDVMRATDLNPKLRQKHQEILKTQAEVEQAKKKLEEIRINKQLGPSQQSQSLAISISLKNDDIVKLASQRDTLKSQVKRLSAEASQQNHTEMTIREFDKETEATRRGIKLTEKDVHKVDKEAQFLDLYSSFVYLQMEEVEKRAQLRRLKANPDAWKQQIELIKQGVDERNVFDKRSVQQTHTTTKKIDQIQAANNDLKRKIRQLHNVVLRSELDVKTTIKRSVTQRTHSSDNLHLLTGKSKLIQKRQRKTSLITPVQQRLDAPDKIPIRIGNTQDTASCIWVTDKPFTEDPSVKLTQIIIYESEKQTICGLQFKYALNNEVIYGKKMLAYSSITNQPKIYSVQSLTSISFLYTEQKICAIAITPTKGQIQTVGVIGPGISRVINLTDFNLLSIDAKLQMQEDINQMAISGIIATIQKKTVLKKNTTMPIQPMEYIEEDIQITQQDDSKQRWKSVSSQKNIIYKGSLPKLNVRKIIDHRLMIFDGGKHK